MSVSKFPTKSRLALLVALAALVAATATQLAPHKRGRSVETARAAQPSVASPSAPAVPAASAAPAAAGARTAATAGAPRAADDPQGAGMRAYIDPATGQLREPEQEELAPPKTLRARLAPAPSTGSEAPDLDIAVPGGGVARLVDDSVAVYAVATIGPDGKVRFEHTQGGAAAQAKVKAASKGHSRTAAEVNNER